MKDYFFPALIAVLVLAFVGILGFMIVDQAFVKTTSQSVDVVSKEFSAAHTTRYPQKVGNVTTYRTIHHSDSWSVTIQADNGRTAECSATEAQYNAAQEGGIVRADIAMGRYSGRVICDQLS